LSLLKSQVRRTAEVQPQGHSAPNKPARHEGLPFKQAIEIVEAAVPAAQVVVVTTMPRGGLQIAQPVRLPEALFKGYLREFHLEDRLTWQAILTGKPVTTTDAFGGAAADSRYVRELLGSNGLTFAAAAPLNEPVIEGYPGAVHVYRAPEQGEFSEEELRKLGEAAAEVDRLLAEAREARRAGNEEPKVTLTPSPAGRLFVYDQSGTQLLAHPDFDQLDSHLRDGMQQVVTTRLSKVGAEPFTADRVQLADSRGDLWTFRAATYARNPGVAPEGPVVMLAMQPTCAEWGEVRPADLSADAELSRLIPAMKFMRQEFHRGPTLGEIAKQVHLSPFHFHRRFAELLGLTPKHFLLDCQISAAKAELLARKKELSQIATDCGFAHQSHFTSRFKQATGLTPTRWRRLANDAQR
jgi:AraC-like DNA-binding protein